MVCEFATDNAEGVVDVVVVDVDLAEALRGTARNPTSVTVVVHHH